MTEVKSQKKESKEKDTEKIPEKFSKIVTEIEKMPLIDLAELVKILEKKFGVSSAPVAVSAPGGTAAAQSNKPAEEKTAFNLELKEVGPQKIQVIKLVRDVTGKGLKESKDLVDAAVNSPQVIKENVKKEEAEQIKKKFEEAGAKIELK